MIEYSGLSAVGGNAEGEIILVDSSTIFKDNAIIKGKIVIIESATPAIVLWLRDAAGLVTERGGITSHGAILAKEYNLPCIVGAKGVYDVNLTGLKGYLYAGQGCLKVEG